MLEDTDKMVKLTRVGLLGLFLATVYSLSFCGCTLRVATTGLDDCRETYPMGPDSGPGLKGENMTTPVTGIDDFTDVLAPVNGEAADASDLQTNPLQALANRDEYLKSRIEAPRGIFSVDIAAYTSSDYLALTEVYDPLGFFTVSGGNEIQGLTSGLWRFDISLYGTATATDADVYFGLFYNDGVSPTSEALLITRSVSSGTAFCSLNGTFYIDSADYPTGNWRFKAYSMTPAGPEVSRQIVITRLPDYL